MTRALPPTPSAGTATDAAASVWFLRTTSLFADQTDSILSWAGEEARTRSFQRGDVLRLAEGARHFIHVVVEGQIKLRTLTESGKEQILDVAGPGDTIGHLQRVVGMGGTKFGGELDALASEAVALSNGSSMAFEVEEFRRLVERRPMVVLNVSRILGLKQQQLQIRLTRLLYRSALGKVAGLLSELAERYGEPASDGALTITIRLTHQEMASLIGVKRETVSECLAELELQEFIRTRRSHVTVLKPAELDRIL